MKLSNNEQIQNIRWALKNINFKHWMENWQYGSSYLSKHEIANRAGSILYENNVQYLRYESDIEKYLNDCEKINQLLEVVYINNLNIEETTEIFNKTLEYLQDKVDVEKNKYENLIESLKRKKLNEL